MVYTCDSKSHGASLEGSSPSSSTIFGTINCAGEKANGFAFVRDLKAGTMPEASKAGSRKFAPQIICDQANLQHKNRP